MITPEDTKKFVDILDKLLSDRYTPEEYSDGIKTITNILNSTAPEPIQPKVNPRIYAVLLNQSGTSKPIINVLRTDFGAVGWNRVSAGVYIARKAGGFPENKTVPTNNPIALYNEDTKTKIVVKRLNNNDIEVRTYNSEGKLSDGMLTNYYLEFNVYL